ncbi:MAG: hypothetical protein OXD54_13615 [Candidatus Poribacteria bacterium]|nr:hypothetical protein [Candidatus Poribacteria bacterium]
MNAVIVDTNVIVIANDIDDKRADCRDRCQDRLQQIISRREKVVIDDDWRILKEYKNNTKPNTRKGIGDVFVKTLLQNLKNPNFCTTVPITPLAGNGTEFKEFPTDSALYGFDPDDRKFIAVALAYQAQFGQTATILLAIDSGWTNYIAALAAHGVSVDSICKEDSS